MPTVPAPGSVVGGGTRIPREPDVVVIGGGTAGSAAARLLASWGHLVVVLEREAARPPLAESLPPSCIPLLEQVGVHDAVARAGFVRGGGNTVWWGGAPMRLEPFPGGRLGYQVQRDRLEAVLAAEAEAAGALRVHPAAALRVAPRTEGGHDIEVSLPEGRTRLRAPWVLDCSGRAGVVARTWRESPAEGIRTVALVGMWGRAGGWPLPDDSHTLVESASWGWGWSVPVSRTRRCFTAMVDPLATPLGGAAQVDERYEALLRSLPALGVLLRDAERHGAAWGCEATPYHAREVAGVGVLLVGDAASMLDPLSSFGVKKALASAWLAAVVVHTAHALPAHLPLALALYREREAAYVSAAAVTFGQLSREAGAPGAGGAAPFWMARAQEESSREGAGHGEGRGGDDLAAALRDDPGVRAAFETLRARGCTRLVPAAGLERIPRPVVRGNVIVPEEHVQLPGLPHAVRFLRNVDLLALLEIASRHDDAGAVYAQYVRQVGPVPLPDLLGGLSVLLAKGAATLA